MKKQTKRRRGCGVRNTKKNRNKRRQTRKVLNGGSAPIPEDAPKTRKRNATPGNNSKERKNKRQNVVATAMGAFRCAMCEEVLPVEAPKHGPSGDGFTPRQCLVAQRAQGKHTLCHDCWFYVFVRSEDHRCPGCEKGLDPRPKEIGNWNPKVMVDLTDSP